MFHTILTLAYLLPNVYLFLRTRLFFTKGRARFIYSIIYFLVFLIYPVSNFAGESGENGLRFLLETVTGYLLPFYLYLFLSMLLLDILLLLNRLFRIIPISRLSMIRSGITGFIIVVCLSLCIVVAGIINFNTINISDYNLNLSARRSEIRNLKIAFASDFHLQNRTPVAFFNRFMKNIELINPDLLIFGGDMVEGDRDDGNLTRFENSISGIRTKYGVYGVPGNHEHYSGQDKSSFFNKAGIRILSDTVLTFNNLFCLGGRSDEHSQGRKKIEDIIKCVDETLPFILIDHRPTDLENVSKEPVDVQFSGHTHNGQLFPINLITRSVYRLSWGHEKLGNTDFFVSSGIRLWGPPVKTAGKSEILLVNITFR